MILSDIQITKLAKDGMISLFESKLVRTIDYIENLDNQWQSRKVLSYGLSSYGYDIRLSSKEFRVFRHVPGHIVNPKDFNAETLENVSLQSDEYGYYFILPAHSYGLGVAVERIKMPKDVTAIAIGKSTYARCGILTNLTPIESAWQGHLTIEISNSSGADCRIYANEGICQLLFFRGDECSVSYQDRQGKYQNQPEQIVFSKV